VNYLKLLWKDIKPYILDWIISLLLTIIIFAFLWKSSFYINGNLNYSALQTLALLLTLFAGWLQFITYKKNKKKEAALTYFPKPLELEQLENDIDKVINFWSSNEPLEPFIVSIMTGEGNNINKCHYELIWNKFSIEIQEKIVKKFKNNGQIIKDSEYQFDEKYIPWIKHELLNVRRKLNAYLNQIEGYCLSINIGNIDNKSAALIFKHKFKKHFNKSFPYIDKVRRLNSDNSIYIEFEKVVKNWNNL